MISLIISGYPGIDVFCWAEMVKGAATANFDKPQPIAELPSAQANGYVDTQNAVLEAGGHNRSMSKS